MFVVDHRYDRDGARMLDRLAHERSTCGRLIPMLDDREQLGRQ